MLLSSFLAQVLLGGGGVTNRNPMTRWSRGMGGAGGRVPAGGGKRLPPDVDGGGGASTT